MHPDRALLRNRWIVSRDAVLLCVCLLIISFGAQAQTNDQKITPALQTKKNKMGVGRVSLTPRFAPGQSFRYEMEFETRTDTRRSGLGTDPQGPTSLVVNWNATVRMDVLSADAAAPGGIRLRTTYEKSAATVTTDTFDPAAEETENQYKKLEGKVVEITLDADRKVKSVAGLEGIVDTQKASQSAHDWISQISASAGAPLGGVSVGQSWMSDQPADSLPLAGLVWRTDSTYLRNEPCHAVNARSTQSIGAAGSTEAQPPAADCAVILANLKLAHGKGLHNETPADLRNNGVQSQGKWEGSGQSLIYVSLATGTVVSVTQTGSQQMDVTLTSNHNTSMHYAGSITSRSQVAMLENEARAK